MEFSIPNAYDETVGDHVTWFYYLSHEDVDNNTIEILARKENRVRFRWNGTTIDPNYYDGSKANANLRWNVGLISLGLKRTESRDNNALHTEPRAARLLETMLFAAAR